MITILLGKFTKIGSSRGNPVRFIEVVLLFGHPEPKAIWNDFSGTAF